MHGRPFRPRRRLQRNRSSERFQGEIHPLSYGKSDICDFRFSTADCKIEFVGVGVSACAAC